jgi:transcription elongation factor Elf1
MVTIANSCEDCGSAVAVELQPYGSSFLAAISCPKCGDSFDTDIDAADIEALS